MMVASECFLSKSGKQQHENVNTIVLDYYNIYYNLGIVSIVSSTFIEVSYYTIEASYYTAR